MTKTLSPPALTRLAQAALFAATLLGATALTPPARAEAPHGNTTRIEGQVEAEGADGARSLALADPVYVEDTVATGVEARADLLFPTGLTLQLAAETRMALRDLGEAAGFAFDLGEGAILVDKPPETAAQPLVINSVFGQVAVRGTKFFVGPSRGAFAVFVERGSVSVSAAGETAILAAGEGVTIDAAGAPPGKVSTWSTARVDEVMALFD